MMAVVYTPEQAERIIDLSITCSHCGAISVIRKRSLNSTMVRQLLALYRFHMNPGLFVNLQVHMGDLFHGFWIHASHYLTHMRLDRECMKLRFWGFLEEHPGSREDGNPHNGYVRMTSEGIAFCQRQLRTYRYILTKNQGEGFIGFVSGEMVDVIDALGNKFDYNKEIRGVDAPLPFVLPAPAGIRWQPPAEED